MTVVQWSPDFATGHREIDDQHQCLVGSISERHGVAANTAGEPGRILECAIDSTPCRFAFEEASMESKGSPPLGAHQRIHDAFVREIRRLKWRFVAATLSADSLVEARVSRLFGHVGRADSAALRNPCEPSGKSS